MQDLLSIFTRDLGTLEREVQLYPDDATLWKAIPGQPNTGGNLALHLVGNLRYFIGRVLGGSGYVRDRDSEFSSTGISRAEVIELVQRAKQEVTDALSRITGSQLDSDYPETVADLVLPARLFLLHLATHLAFHLGQIDYHRRAASGRSDSAFSVSLMGLGLKPTV